MREIRWEKQPLRTLNRMPRNEARRIVRKIEQYAVDPQALAKVVKRIRNRSGLRMRIGDWRVIFDDDGRVMLILWVGPRGEAYK